MSAGLVAVTVTPGSSAPVLSVTVPLMLPVVCAQAGTTVSTIRTMASPYLRMFVLLLLLLPNKMPMASQRRHGRRCQQR